MSSQSTHQTEAYLQCSNDHLEVSKMLCLGLKLLFPRSERLLQQHDRPSLVTTHFMDGFMQSTAVAVQLISANLFAVVVA
jgi:hypothetical protein